MEKIFRNTQYVVNERGDIVNTKFGRKLMPSLDKRGYLRVTLSINKKAKAFQVHRIVAELFIPNTNNQLQVNHIDGIKTNNNYSNLEWCTGSENILHAFKIGLKSHVGEKNVFVVLTEGKVLEIRKNGKNETYKKIAERWGVSIGCIAHILERRTWTHI